ncbi:hypothetical protein PSACC_00746 [Paramicrosporidium saccamoebae]|uniref:Uncharacterized protein n=1 Tax=Paramicrosporidium saccamoebae TaxID=1246581 RepID=A0A2H9TNZ5_9FUNG|nr:hypothetical protein PSACC_00746 [Paramicrosporidium saccamoebae]
MRAAKLFLLLLQPSQIDSLRISFTPHRIVRECQSSDLKAIFASYEISSFNYLSLHSLLLYGAYDFVRHYCTVRESSERIAALVKLRHYREFHDSLLHISKLGSQPTLAAAIFENANMTYEGRVVDLDSQDSATLSFEAESVFKGIANAALLQISSMRNLRKIAELIMLNDQKNVAWLFDLLAPVMIPEFLAIFLSRDLHTNVDMIAKCNNFLHKGALSPFDHRIRALVLICGMRIKQNSLSVEYENILCRAWSIVTVEDEEKPDFGAIFDTLWTASDGRQDLQYWALMAHMSALVLTTTRDCSRLISVVLKAIPDHLPPALSVPLLEKYLECRPVARLEYPLSHLPLVAQPLSVRLQRWTREGPRMAGHLYRIPPGPPTIAALHMIVEQPYRYHSPLSRISPRMALPLNLVFEEPYLDSTDRQHFRFTDAILAAAEEILLSRSITSQSLSILIASWAILLAERRRMDLSSILRLDESWRAWAKRTAARIPIGPNFVLYRLELWRISTNFAPAELLELVSVPN